MATFPETLAALAIEDGVGHAAIAEDWMQGRTVFGGLSAALAFRYASIRWDLAPLRSAQIAFSARASESLEFGGQQLAKGRSSSFVSVDVRSDGANALRCLFVCGTQRAARTAIAAMPPPRVDGPEAGAIFLSSDMAAPRYVEHFEYRLAEGARPWTGSSGEIYFSAWVRHRDGGARGSGALLALADAAPPAVAAALAAPVPVSTMTWQADFLGDEAAFDPWKLLSVRLESNQDGYSNETLVLWSRSGQPLLVGRQLYAVFEAA